MAIISFSKGTGALNTLTQIQKSETTRTTSISKISSSLKIRKASDAVADSAIGTKLKVEVDSLKQLLVGTAQAKAALDIAEGGLGEITKTLTRMNTLAMSAKNGIYKAEDIAKINQEFVALIDEIDRIAKATNFNSKQLLSGTQKVITDTFSETINGDDLRDGFLSKDGQGIEAIAIDNSKSNTAYTLSYNQETRLFRITNLNDRSSFDEMKVASDDIKSGDLESLNFSKFGITVKLNNNFDKGMSIGTDTALMMDPQYNQNNKKNIELINSISDKLIDNASVIGEELFKPKLTAGKVKVDGDARGTQIILPTKLNTEADAVALSDIKTALGLGDTGKSIKIAGKANGDIFSTTELEEFNNELGGQGVTITEIKVKDNIGGADTVTQLNNLTLFKITDYSKDGIVTFEAASSLKGNGDANDVDVTITGTFKLDATTYENGTFGIDYDKQSIEKDVDGNAVVLKGGSYKLKSTDIIGDDGYVYDKSGKKITTIDGDPNSTVQLKLNNKKTNNVDVARISGNLTDLTSFDVKIKGTNGMAKLYMEAADGVLESDYFNLTDIDYNDNTSSYVAKNRLERGRVTLSRTMTNGQRVDAITIDLNKMKTGGIIEAAKLTDADAPKNLAMANVGQMAADAAGTNPFVDSGYFNNNVFVSLNELKNTVVAYQESSDKTDLSFQVGTGGGDENSVKVTIDSITAFRLQLIDNKTNLKVELSDDQESLQKIIETIRTAIDTVQSVRSKVAVGDNRLNVADSNIQTSITNSQAAVSAIFDLDIPEEMVELSQSEMMEQSSIEVLSREMRSKQNLLKLF